MLADFATVVALAIIPLTELQAALPLGIHTFGLSPVVATVAALVGNAVPALFIIMFLESGMHWLGRYLPPVHRFVDHWLVRSREKVRPQIERYGAIGLFLFVAVPFPLTGVWTGAFGAVLLGIPHARALIAIFGGMLVTAGIVLAADRGLIHLVGLF